MRYPRPAASWINSQNGVVIAAGRRPLHSKDCRQYIVFYAKLRERILPFPAIGYEEKIKPSFYGLLAIKDSLTKLVQYLLI